MASWRERQELVAFRPAPYYSQAAATCISFRSGLVKDVLKIMTRPTSSAIYVIGQNDVRDAELSLLDCRRASVSAFTSGVNRLLSSGRSSHSCLPWRAASALHLRPA